jgi:hypothetical protein
MLKSFLRLGVNVGLLFLAIFVVHFAITGNIGTTTVAGIFKQQVTVKLPEQVNVSKGNWDLTTTLGRELASREKPVSPYTVKKCGEIRHTDGDTLTICLVKFNGTSGGFYDANKSLMVLGSFNDYTLVHEIFHAASIHNYKKGFTDMMNVATQEKMAYDAENLLMQIHAFQEDFTITPDISTEKKEKLGLPTEKILAKN